MPHPAEDLKGIFTDILADKHRIHPQGLPLFHHGGQFVLHRGGDGHIHHLGVGALQAPEKSPHHVPFIAGVAVIDGHPADILLLSSIGGNGLPQVAFSETVAEHRSVAVFKQTVGGAVIGDQQLSGAVQHIGGHIQDIQRGSAHHRRNGRIGADLVQGLHARLEHRTILVKLIADGVAFVSIKLIEILNGHGNAVDIAVIRLKHHFGVQNGDLDVFVSAVCGALGAAAPRHPHKGQSAQYQCQKPFHFFTQFLAPSGAVCYNFS